MLLYQPSPGHLKNLRHIGYGWKIKATTDKQKAFNEIMDAEVVLGNHFLVEVLPNAQHLRWLQSASAGVDYIIKQDTGILQNAIFTNVKGVYDTELSEHALALIFSLCRNLHLLRDKQNEKIWLRQQQLDTIAGKKVIILGWGSLGKSIGYKLKMLGASINAVRNAAEDLREDGITVWGKNNWQKELPSTNILLLSLPLTKETNNLVTHEILEMLPPDAIVINIGRAATLDEAALFYLLKTKRLRGAALDVFLQEPLAADHPAWEIENLIITPHTARSNEQPPYRYEQLFETNFKRYVDGEPLLNIVDIQKGY